MASPEPDAPERFHPGEFLAQAKDGHVIALGIHYAAHGDDWCELSLGYDRRLVADATSGILASGPIVSLMDMATALAVWSRRGGMRPHATLDLRVDYLRPGRVGRSITGRGECYRVTRRIAFVRGVAHDGDIDDPIAHVAGTYMLLDSWR